MKPICDDPDTNRLLQVVSWALTRHFGHSADAAEALVRSSYERFSPRWDDNFYHEEGAFRSAALLQYSLVHGGTSDFNGFHDWYAAQKLFDAERETLEYFRQFYFDTPLPNDRSA